MRSWTGSLAFATLSMSVCLAHDIPDANVDRSIQVDIYPGRIRIDYEISLSDLTLTQDLKALIGHLPTGVRTDWFKRYGEETGPLNARGLILTIDGETVEPTYRDHDLVVEDEPHFTFHIEAAIPSAGRLRLIDSNYAAAEGTSRLAIRGRDGIVVKGDSLPTEVEHIAQRPVWQLSADEERRSKQVQVDYHSEVRATESKAVTPVIEQPKVRLDWTVNPAWAALSLLAFLLGLANPSPPRPGQSSLASDLAANLIPFACLLGLASVLWMAGVTESAGSDLVVRHSIGFALTALGLWRVGHHLGDTGPNEKEPPLSHDPEIFASRSGARRSPSLDALVLFIFATVLGRVGLIIILSASYSCGTIVLLVAERTSTATPQSDCAFWQRHRRQLGLFNGTVLAIMGAILLTNGFDTLR